MLLLLAMLQELVLVQLHRQRTRKRKPKRESISFQPHAIILFVKLTDIADSIAIDPRKLTQYALNPDSLYGKHKALVFERALGITLKNYNVLVAQIETQIENAELSFHSADEFGKRYFGDLEVTGIEGKRATVRTGWFIAGGTRVAQLATIYVKKR